METEEDDIDIRSEAVRDYLEQIPSRLTRWGSTVVFLVLFIVVGLTCVIKYPTRVHADFKLTTRIEPKSIVSKTTGRVEKILVGNHTRVSSNQHLVFLESSAIHEEVLQLEMELDAVRGLFQKGLFTSFDTLTLPSREHLGDVQTAYQLYRQQLAQITSLLGKNYFSKTVDILKNDISELKNLNDNLQIQYELYSRDAMLAQNEFTINENLYKDKVISTLDLNKEESKLLAKKIPLKNIESAILNNRALIRVKEKEILDLEKELFEQKEIFEQSINALKSAIASWKNRYVLVSPSAGEITFSNNLQEKQYVDINNELFQVFEYNSNYVGNLTIPQENSGKIKIGQNVLIKFHGYPFEEYGMVEGKISSFPQLSTQDRNSFFAIVELPNGLTTTYNKTLTYNYGMMAKAEVVTEDLLLIERIFLHA